jgi:hypothetical protein
MNYLNIGKNYRSAMKKIILLFSFLMMACSSECIDCGGQVVHQLNGITNISGFDVKVVFFAEDTITANINANEDYLYVEENREKNIPSYECGLFVDGCDSSPINVTLIFLTEPQKCIDFKGNVEDKTKDLRTIEAYKETGEGLIIGALVKFYQFYITPEMYEQAELCE